MNHTYENISIYCFDEVVNINTGLVEDYGHVNIFVRNLFYDFYPQQKKGGIVYDYEPQKMYSHFFKEHYIRIINEISDFPIFLLEKKLKSTRSGILRSNFLTVPKAYRFQIRLPMIQVSRIEEILRFKVDTPPKYHLRRYNCAAFVNDVLKEAGLLKIELKYYMPIHYKSVFEKVIRTKGVRVKKSKLRFRLIDSKIVLK